jgi:hypothetical protein
MPSPKLKKPATVAFVISRDQLKILRDIAAREDVGFSSIVRRCIRTYLQTLQGGAQPPGSQPRPERLDPVHAPSQPSQRAA